MVPQPFRILRRGTARFAAAGLGVWAALAISCQSVPLLAPSGSTLTIIPAANEVGSNGSMSITVTVIEGTTTSTGTGTGGSTTTTPGVGQPVHDGTEVSFTTTVGTIQPATAKTTNGQVTVQLVANGQSGQAKITAYSGAATASTTINVGAAAAARIVVTANPQSLPGTGGTSTIVASVQDGSGVGLAGVAVGFSTSAGSLSQPTVTTDANGNASTTLTTTQAATVTASAAGSTSSGGTTTTGLSGTVAITLNPRTAVTLTAPTAAAVVSTPTAVGVAVASSTTGVTPIINAMQVNWGDGQVSTFNALVSSVTHLYAAAQIFTVTVTVTDSTGASSSGAVQVAVGPLTASVTSQPTTITHGAPAVFTVAPSNAAAEIDHYEWTWGDGSAVESTGTGTDSHVFAAAGSDTILVRVVPTVGAPITVPIAIVIG